ncbi:hypothetical protein NN561_000241 [Cricetulus griseus]
MPAPSPPIPGSPVPFNGSAPRPQVLRSRRPWSCNLCAAAPAFSLTPRSKSFPPRRDARNANNQTSAPAWAGLEEWWGAPGPSRVHPRAGPGGDTKKPGTPTPTAGARRDLRGAPPAAKFAAPGAPRCPPPGRSFPRPGWEPRIRRLLWGPGLPSRLGEPAELAPAPSPPSRSRKAL